MVSSDLHLRLEVWIRPRASTIGENFLVLRCGDFQAAPYAGALAEPRKPASAELGAYPNGSGLRESAGSLVAILEKLSGRPTASITERGKCCALYGWSPENLS